jgi:hypothetical protein
MKTIQYSYLRPLLGLAVGLMMTSAAVADGPPARILSSQHVQYGRSHGEWAAAWWQWCLSIPHATHPLFTSGNVDASIGQTGPVWFLGGNFAGGPGPVVRNCTIPESKALFFPVINYEDSEVEEAALGNPGLTINALRAIVEPAIDEAAGSSTLLLEVNGHPVRNLGTTHRLQSPAFSYTLPADNIWSVVYGQPFAAGTYNPAIDDGIYVMLAPLHRGQHVIHFHAEIPSFSFVVDVTYNVTVN